jgi:hypothetical protein
LLLLTQCSSTLAADTNPAHLRGLCQVCHQLWVAVCVLLQLLLLRVHLSLQLPQLEHQLLTVTLQQQQQQQWD